MSNPKVPRRPSPSLWAIGLLIISSGFALLMIGLFSTDFRPF